MNTGGRLPFVDQLLSTMPPTHLYHYTSPTGLIGICETKTIWANGAAFMNDAKEQLAAPELAKNSLTNRLNRQRSQLSTEEIALFEEMIENVFAANRQIYTVSFTKKPDTHLQWKAHCPTTGGYAIGFPSAQLRAVGEEQGFYLAPCIYEHTEQYRLVDEIIDHHLRAFHSVATNGGDVAIAKADAVRGFAKDIAEYGPILKHFSFEDEEEWRLVSEPKNMTDRQLGFHTGSRSIIPHYELKLTTNTQPNLCVPGEPDKSLVVRVGPTLHNSASQSAVQALLFRHIGPECAVGPTNSTLRGY